MSTLMAVHVALPLEPRMHKHCPDLMLFAAHQAISVLRCSEALPVRESRRGSRFPL